jgi:hypothetical protein
MDAVCADYMAAARAAASAPGKAGISSPVARMSVGTLRRCLFVGYAPSCRALFAGGGIGGYEVNLLGRPCADATRPLVVHGGPAHDTETDARFGLRGRAMEPARRWQPSDGSSFCRQRCAGGDFRLRSNGRPRTRRTRLWAWANWSPQPSAALPRRAGAASRLRNLGSCALR